MLPTLSARRTVLAAGTAALATAGLLATALDAQAVSGGGYSYTQQGCTATADRNDQPESTQPGCHNATLQLNAGDGSYAQRWHVLSVNSDQLPDGQSPHAGSVSLDPGQGTQYTVRFDTGTGTFILVNPLGFATDLASWLVGGGQGPFPLPQQVIGTPGQPSAGVDQSKSRQRSATDALGDQQVYFGADDNLDNGEHDGFTGIDGPCGLDPNTGQPYQCGSGGAINGASDGGALLLSITPQAFLASPTPSATNPEGLVNASEGECADSICAEATTQQQAVYYGCVQKPKDSSPEAAPKSKQNNGGNNWGDVTCTSGTPSSTKAYQNDTPASTQEGPNCNGGGPYSTETAPNCSETPNAYRASTPSRVYAEPGVQTYQDPDPQRSPALPFATPGLYVGTCGVYANDGGGDGLPGITGQNPGYVGGQNFCPAS